MEKKKRVFSGIKPSGEMTLANYLGMLTPAMKAQEGKENIFSVVNYHAITVPQDPSSLKKRTIEIAKIYLAAGLDLSTSTLFVQSDIPEHTELCWILNCITSFGHTSRMTQFKDQYKVKSKDVTVGLFDYPILMAADIILYDTTEVPVGDDQKQHVELARDIAEKFNKRFGKTFVVPKPTIAKEGARIKSLTNPEIKMSKSDENPNSYILLTDSAETIRKKISKATTDSDGKIKYDLKFKPGISNLLNILSVCTDTSIKNLEIKYKNSNYGELKSDVAQGIIDLLTPFQKKYQNYSDKEVKEILKNGAKKIKPLAEKKMKEVREKVGIGY